MNWHVEFELVAKRAKLIAWRFFDRSPNLDQREEQVQEVLCRLWQRWLHTIAKGHDPRRWLAFDIQRECVNVYRGCRLVPINFRCDLFNARVHKAKVRSLFARSIEGGCETKNSCLADVIANRDSNPAEEATIRLDYAEWLATLPARDQLLVSEFLEGKTLSEASERFGCGRVWALRKRKEWQAFWQAYQALSK